MSVLGQKQTYAVQNAVSALAPKADICTATNDVRFGPEADIAANSVCKLFDHFVSAGEQRRRHGDAERLGRLEIDYQLVLAGRLHR